MTLSKLAQLAHVSVSTVSKAFSMSPEIHPETREMIFNLAKEHGCFRKHYKAKYPKYVIAIICPEFKYSEAISAAQQRLAELGCEICVASTDFSPQKEMDLLHYYDRYTEVDGIIAIDHHIEYSGVYNLPVVSVSAHESTAPMQVRWDPSGAHQQLVEYLCAQGAEPIAYIGEPLTHTKSFFKAYPDAPVFRSQYRFEKGGYDAMERLLAAPSRPRSVLCAYDYLALGALRCLHDHGLKCPEDIAIVGMNNIHQDPYMCPSLTSVDTKMKECAQLAAETLVAYLKGELIEEITVLPAEVCWRESTNLGGKYYE